MSNVFLDADGVLVDFEAGAAQAELEPKDFKLQPGSYLFLPMYYAAQEALRRLRDLESRGVIKLWIATKPPTDNPYAAAEKLMYFNHHLPWLKGRVIITPDKSILGGPDDFLIDDRPHKANASQFKGTFIHFDVQDPERSWYKLILAILTKHPV